MTESPTRGHVPPDRMTAPNLAYTPADISRWFSPHDIRKAQSYGHAVSALTLGLDHIEARVKGTARTPYRVHIEFFEAEGKPEIEALCTCPVGRNCKHCVAVLVAALVERDRSLRPNPAVLEWAERARRALKPARKAAKKAAPGQSQIQYVLLSPPPGRPWRLALLKGRITHGTPSAQHWNNIDRALVQPPRFVVEADLDVFRLLHRLAPSRGYWNDLPLTGEAGALALDAMLPTGRVWLADTQGREYTSSVWRCTPLGRGKPRAARLSWRPQGEGALRAVLDCEPTAGKVLGTEPPWYVDAAAAEAGPLECGEQAPLLHHLLALPPLARVDLPVVAELMADIAPELPSPLAAAEDGMVVIPGPPRPVLRLATMYLYGWGQHRAYPARHGYEHQPYDYATYVFRYGEGDARAEVQPGDGMSYIALADGRPARVARDASAEAARLKDLLGVGFEPLPKRAFYNEPFAGRLGLESEAAWARFLAETAPRLRALGWEVEFPRDYRHHILAVEAWEAELEQEEGGWFSLDMGVVVEGRRLPLAPLLVDLFRREPRWLDAGKLKRIGDDEKVILQSPDGARLAVPAERVKPLATTLIDLFDNVPASGEMRLSALDAPRLEQLTDPSRWQFKGADAVIRLAQRLRQSQGVQPVPAPPGFALDLRPYQQEGLAWLQYLRGHELGGILADDMGLGKTAQTLAHLLTEKQAGRLARPALVVLPTSLVFNWKREAARCAPDLRVLSLHGKERFEAFARIPEHDVCLTTYPLLWRDEAELAKHEYALLILDEAQTVKNAKARAAAVVRTLKAGHRLCLTGTPLENHLGELWAQFDFLLPGFLGDSKQFAQTWRTPIEKRGDRLRGELLARRIAPFILRRRKEEVARELPEKSLIVRTVELEGGQRDLYETVRAAMDARVREEIASKGFNRSQIVILDALLKLRQVCCDPRLLKTVRAAEKVKGSAKLELLMDMLPELVEEGRRVLVFSQFTTMLELIAAALDKAGIAHVRLTGQTVDREQAVAAFQAGEVPVFLISLKAGGVGLNLTAADTVIHYDPWWNPAAENQATDRAHRIGQVKKVFVYKLVVAGSIEERIIALQDKKAALAAGVLGEDADALAKFGEDDLRALLAPLPA